jgi:competence protein ComFC
MIALPQSLQSWVNTGLGFFYPEICRLCEMERASARDGFVGPRCRAQVRFIEPPFCRRCGLPFGGDLTTPFECTNCRELELHFSSARSAVIAGGIVREAIHRFKYQRQLWFEDFLAGLFLREAVPTLRGENWGLIVPVPLHPVNGFPHDAAGDDR